MTTNSTDSARADAALRDSERFRSVADAAPAMLWVTERNGECSFLSRGWRDFTGQDEAKGLGTGWLDPLHADERASVEAAFTAAAARRAPFNLEHRLRRHDGAYRWVIDSGRPRFGDDGSFLGYVGIVVDITERQQKEVDLGRSREQLELLSDTLPALISYIGPDRCYRTCNALYSKWFGLPREKIVGNTIEEVLGPAAWCVVGPHFERTLAGEPSEFEAEVDYRHGGKRWIHARYTPHRGHGGEVVGVACLVTDITARREAGHTRARLAVIIDSSDDAIVSKTLDGTITSWNAGAARLFGYSAAEAVGQPITMLIPEDRRHEEQGILARIRTGEPVKPYETIRRRKDGALFGTSLSVSPIMDEAGNIVGASKIARDITARKRAEQDVRRSREALNGLIDRAPFGIYIVDNELKIAHMNARSQAGAFYNVRPIIGRKLEEVMRIMWPEPVATEIVEAFRETLKTGETYRSRNFMSARADSENVESYEWEIHRITLPDGKAGAVSYYFDTTRLRRAEHGLREADRRKDEFLATLAHELRNPLAPIRNGLQILRLAARDPVAMTQVQEMLERQVNHLVGLVDDLMEVARVTRGRIELRREPVDLGAMLRSAVETSRPLIEAAQHELVVDLPEEPVTLIADPVRLAQIVANLLNNAAKYTEDGGRISLAGRCEGNHAVVSVRDTGVGIPIEVLPRVFDLFAQADRTYHRAQGGLGIGLTLVRTLVELHGGTVSAKSEGVGRGSEFVVRLPLGVELASRRDGEREEADSVFAAHRFLVVDDSRDAAQSLALLLESLGADVHTATDGPG